MSQFICQEATAYQRARSYGIPFCPPTFHMNAGECTKSLPNEMHFSCFPTPMLSPWKVLSLYVNPTDLKNCEQSSEEKVSMNHVFNEVHCWRKSDCRCSCIELGRNGKRSVGLGSLCSFSSSFFSIKPSLFCHLGVSNDRDQRQLLKGYSTDFFLCQEHFFLIYSLNFCTLNSI